MINPKNIVQLQESFNPQYDFQSIITDDEKVFAVQLENVIKDALDADIFFETSSTLCYEDESVIPDPFIVDEDDSEEIINENNKKVIVSIDFEYKKKAVQYWKSAKKGKLKLKTVQNQFKKLKNQNMLYRWESQVEEGGNRIEKLSEICRYVVNEFQNAHEKSLPFHDVDIKRWALKGREQVSLSQEPLQLPQNGFTILRKSTKLFPEKLINLLHEPN